MKTVASDLTKQAREPRRSVLSRHTAGWIGVCAGVVTFVAVVTGRKVLATYSVILFWCVPLLAVIVHLNFTRVLNAGEKEAWRGVLWQYPYVGMVITVWESVRG